MGFRGCNRDNPQSIEGVPVTIIVPRLCLINVRMVGLKIASVFELIAHWAPVSEFI
jgi:hypothetical protein